MHFWIGLIGILLYVASMWVSGIMEGLMLSATNEAGTALKYSNFVTVTQAKHILLLFRAIGGSFYLLGFILCAVNIFMTIRIGKPENVSLQVPLLPSEKNTQNKGIFLLFRRDPIHYVFGVIFFLILWFFLPKGLDLGCLLLAILLAAQAIWAFSRAPSQWADFYDSVERNWIVFTILVFISVSIGGAVQIIPTVIAQKGQYVSERRQVLFTPLELAGRDIYIAEGCYNCHSQMIRMLPGDIMRYGKSYLKDAEGKPLKGGYSRLGESIYNHPFQWGSKRTGPDLAREGGGVRSNLWHYNHLIDPRSTSEGSVMPSYHWLLDERTDYKALPQKIKVLASLGVPYPPMDKNSIEQGAMDQAFIIARGLVNDNVILPKDLENLEDENSITAYLANRQVIALIAYLQKLGAYQNINKPQKTPPSLANPDSKHQDPSPQSY